MSQIILSVPINMFWMQSMFVTECYEQEVRQKHAEAGRRYTNRPRNTGETICASDVEETAKYLQPTCFPGFRTFCCNTSVCCKNTSVGMRELRLVLAVAQLFSLDILGIHAQWCSSRTIAVCTQMYTPGSVDGSEEFLPCGSRVARLWPQSCGISLVFARFRMVEVASAHAWLLAPRLYVGVAGLCAIRFIDASAQ